MFIFVVHGKMVEYIFVETLYPEIKESQETIFPSKKLQYGAFYYFEVSSTVPPEATILLCAEAEILSIERLIFVVISPSQSTFTW